MNKYTDGLQILAEDEDLASIVSGFFACANINFDHRRVDDKGAASGWTSVQDWLCKSVSFLEKYDKLCRLGIVDFDGYENRATNFKKKIPEEVRDRVFVLGPIRNVETLKKETGLSLERIGAKIARTCASMTPVENSIWQCDQLKHNIPEVERLKKRVGSFLFKS